MVQAEFKQKLETIKSRKMTLKFCDKSKTPYSWIQIHVFLKMRIAFLCVSLLSTSKWHFQVPKKMTYVTTRMLSSGPYWFPLFYPFCMDGQKMIWICYMYVWTWIFFKAENTLHFQKYPDMCGQGERLSYSVVVSQGDHQVLL